MVIKKLHIGNTQIGPGHPIYIIAELACAHEGDFEFAQQAVDAAIQAKVSAIKFQVFTADGLVVHRHKLYNAYLKYQFELQQWQILSEQAHKGGIDVLVDVFEPWSIKVARTINADCLKVHSTNVTNPFFLEKVAEVGLPVLIGTGGTFKEEIISAVNIMLSHHIHIGLIHGFQGYPTSEKDVNLRCIKNLIHDFGVPIGYAGHADRNGEGLIYRNILAMGIGCSIIENHITLDSSPLRTDHHSALNPKELGIMVSILREMESVLGTGGYELSHAEKKYRETFKTYLVSVRSFNAGHTLSVDDFAYKRAEYGIMPSEADRFIGRTLKNNITKDEVLTEDLLIKENMQK